MKTYASRPFRETASARKSFPPARKCWRRSPPAATAFRFEFENFDWGGDYFRQHGVMMPEDGLDALRDKDAILFGSAGDPHIPDHVTLWGLRLKICQGFDQYANVRPTRILPGIDGPLKRCRPEDLNWVIVRENSEGEYSGVGGRVHQGHPIEAATDVSMMTRAGVERIMRFAFKLAQSRPRKLLTVITKSNAQRHAMVMWDEIALQISKEFPDVNWDKELVDASTARMINRPGLARHHRRHQPACRHPERPRRRPGRQPGHRARPATSTRSAAIRRCSSRSTAPPSTSWARAWPIPSAPSGRW